MYKQYCDIHRQVIIGYGDGDPICSMCDMNKYWHIEPLQQRSFDSFHSNQQKRIPNKQLVLKLQKKIKTLSTSFQIVENYLINSLNQLVAQQLNDNLNIRLIDQIIDKVDIITSILSREMDNIQNTNSDKIANLFNPKRYRLMTLEKNMNQSNQVVQNNAQAPQQVQNQVVLNNDQAPQQNKNVNNYPQQNQQNNQFNLAQNQQNTIFGFQNYPLTDVQKQFKNIPAFNRFVSEQQFYNSIDGKFKYYFKATILNNNLYQMIMEKKLCIDMAPEELQKMNRMNNYYQLTFSKKLLIKGYSQNYMLNGRGMVIGAYYFENGYYVQGLLIWGQIIIYQNNEIEYLEIDIYDSIEVIRQSSGQQLLWNKYHLARYVN